MQKKETTFCTVFPAYSDIHFYKDPGQIPFRFSRLGYLTSIVTFSDETILKETRSFVTVIKLKDTFLCRKFNLGILFFLFRNSSRINILNLFHFTWMSLLSAFVYKKINPGGFVYLKMDSSSYSGVYEWEGFFDDNRRHAAEISTSLKARIKYSLIRKFCVNKVDLWSVEDDHTNNDYQSRFGFMKGRMVTVYNGHTADLCEAESVSTFDNKEDIILTVGRLGTYQKGTELLLEAFRMIAGSNSFNLHLAGPTEPAFESGLQSFLMQNPGLRDRVFMHGNLDKKELFRLYNRSKILCMPSRFEGMAVVFPEAMYYRNAVVTTPYVSPAGIIKDYRLGVVTLSAEPSQLAEGLMSMISDMSMLRLCADNAHNFAKKEFNWDYIVGKLNEEITRRRKN